MLWQVFGDTLDYEWQVVGRNDGHTGGKGNSFTPGYIPNMSPYIWSLDYSTESDHGTVGVFIHEMMHVWQSGHGGHNIRSGLWLGIKYGIFGDYGDAYNYDLDDSPRLSSFNMEQAGAIIEDYYRVSKGLEPENNKGTRKLLSDYAPYVAQLKAAGAFQRPKPAPKPSGRGRMAP